MIWLALLATVAAILAYFRHGASPSPPIEEELLAPDEITRQFERAQRVIQEYGSLLEFSPQTLMPESALPASKEEIKASILKVLATHHLSGQATPDMLENCRSCYALLSNFVSPELAAHSSNIATASRMAKDPDFQKNPELLRASVRLVAAASRAGAIGGQPEEYRRLRSEFDARWNAMREAASEERTV